MLPPKRLSIQFCIAVTFCLPVSAEASKSAISNPISSKGSDRTKNSKTAARGSQDSGQSPRWESVQSTLLAPRPIWELVPSDQASSSLNWQEGATSQQPTATPAPKVDTDSSNTQPSTNSPPIPGLLDWGEAYALALEIQPMAWPTDALAEWLARIRQFHYAQHMFLATLILLEIKIMKEHFKCR